jgi:hypothetical protein
MTWKNGKKSLGLKEINGKGGRDSHKVPRSRTRDDAREETELFRAQQVPSRRTRTQARAGVSLSP